MELFQSRLLPRLAEMQDNIIEMIEAKKKGKTTIELIVKNWCTPFSLLPLAVISDTLGMNITYGRNNSDVKRYLKTIRFPKGTSSINSLRQSSTYLPISRLSIDKGDKYLTKYEERILEGIKDSDVRSSFQNSLKYLTCEMTTNIKEHARVQDYWILSQYWPKTETCELVIADTGIGYKESYQNTPFRADNHEEAIKNAIEGISSKGDEERGTGIPGMIKIFCEGYKGSVVIMSGDRLLLIQRGKRVFYELEFDWQGVFIGIRFKLGVINALKYLAG